MADVVAFGELLVDFHSRGNAAEKSLIGDAGGAPANVLCCLTRLGGSGRFVGKIGTDAFGVFLRQTLNEVGIDTTYLSETSRSLTTLAFVSLDLKGERSFSFMRNPGADLLYEPKDFNPKALDDARYFHFGSLSLTHDPARHATLAAAKMARDRGLIISYDPNWRPLLWPSLEEGVQGMKLGLAYADIVKVSLEELTLLTEQTELTLGAQELLSYGPELVLVTLGEDGCYYQGQSGMSGNVTTKSVRAVDTTGAGDAFLGALLYQLSQQSGRPGDLDEELLRTFLLNANVAGALTASRHGTFRAFPTWVEIQENL